MVILLRCVLLGRRKEALTLCPDKALQVAGAALVGAVHLAVHLAVRHGIGRVIPDHRAGRRVKSQLQYNKAHVQQSVSFPFLGEWNFV